MAEAVGTDVMCKKEGKVGMTTLTFRSKQYTFPSLIVKPDGQTQQSPGTTDPENICVLLDVGLFCPFCTGTFTAKFVRSHGRLALGKQGSFELEGQEVQQGQLVLSPEHAGHTCQHDHTQAHSQDSDDSDLGLKRNVEKEFNESGIHVHITPQAGGEQPKFAKIVPLSPQHSRPHQLQQQQQKQPHHHHHSHQPHHRHHQIQPQHSAQEGKHHGHPKQREQDPYVIERQKLMRQNLKQQHRERQLQIRQQQTRYLQSLENTQKQMGLLKGGHVYVEQKSSQYVIKHDLSKKHGSKRAPPPPPPIAKTDPRRQSFKDQNSESKESKQDPPAKARRKHTVPLGSPDRRRRAGSIDRQEIVYEGENIATSLRIETNLDDYSQTVTTPPPMSGEIRTPPIKPRRLHSREYKGLEATSPTSPTSPTKIDPYRVIAKRKRKSRPPVDRTRDENQNLVNQNLVAVANERSDTKHESLEKLSPTATNQQAPWASDNDIYRQPMPVNRLAKQTPPKIPPRLRRSDPQKAQKSPEDKVGKVTVRHQPRQGSETRSIKSEGRSSIRSSASETEQENWIKISRVPSGSPARETLGPVVEPARNERHEVNVRGRTNGNQILSQTDERIINYLGEQAAIRNYREQPMDISDAPMSADGPSMQIPRRGMLHTNETNEEEIEVQVFRENDVIDADSTEVKRRFDDPSMGMSYPHANYHAEDSDDTLDELDDEEDFNPEDTVDEILENIETETYSPTSTLSRAFTGPRGKKKKKKPLPAELQLESAQEESELHEAVAQIVENELRTPSPEAILEEILEGVDDRDAVTGSPDWDPKHSRTTTAVMNTKTSTTYTSEQLQRVVTVHGSSTVEDFYTAEASESPAREDLEYRLNSLNADHEESKPSPSTSCECIPEDVGDNLSLGRSVSTYDGTSENSENEEAQDSESSGFQASPKKPGSETSIEKIIDKTLYLTDKILAAYPQIEQNEKTTDVQDGTLASVATQSSFSDYDEVAGPEECQDEDAAIDAIVSRELEEEEERPLTSHHMDYQFHGAYDELNNYMKREEGDNSGLKETFDSQLSVKTESDFINTEFHCSEAYSPPSPQVRAPLSEDQPSAMSEMESLVQDRVSLTADTGEEDPQAKGLILDKVTKDLYDIQRSLSADEEKWLMEDFYRDTEMAELESSSDQGTMEKKRLSRQLILSTSVDRVEEETGPSERKTQDESDSDVPMVPRKVQFWVPQKERGVETEEEDEETLESFERVEERLREMEQTVKEMGGLDSLEEPSDQEATSKEDLREVDDDQYNSEHTTEEMDQLESSCTEDIGSEIDDVIEALMMEEQFGDNITEIVESESDFKYVSGEESSASSVDRRDKKHGPLQYVSPISTSGSESESEEEPKTTERAGVYQCDDGVNEVTVAKADAQTLVQDVVKRDSMQRSEVCITYVNIDGSSSDSITDPYIDGSDESVVFVNKASDAGSFDSVKLEEVQEESREKTFATEPKKEVSTKATTSKMQVELQPEKVISLQPVKETKPTIVWDKSSDSSSESESETDSEKDFQNIYNKYAEYDQVANTAHTSEAHIQVETTKQSSDHVDIVQPLDKPLEEECDRAMKAQENMAEDLLLQPHHTEDKISVLHEEKNIKRELNQTMEPERKPVDQPITKKSEDVKDSSELAVAKSTTNVTTSETEDVFSKEQAQEFLKHMFGANHAEGHKKESEDLEACLSDVCKAVSDTTVAESKEDYEVKEEEVSTQEITLIFAWPRNKSHPIKRYEDPFREIHLRRVTKIKDFDIEVIEGPTVTTIERQPVASIEDAKPTSVSKKLPSSDSIVVSQKRKETVTKRVMPSQEQKHSEDTVQIDDKESKMDRSEDEDDGSSCGRPLSSEVEVDLDELLGGIPDVSDSEPFDLGGEKLEACGKRDASAQTDALSPDSCTWSDDQFSLRSTDSDRTDEEACFSSIGEGEHSTHAHTGAQVSMSAHRSTETNATQSLKTHPISDKALHRLDASTQTGRGYVSNVPPENCAITAHGSSIVSDVDRQGSVEFTLAGMPIIASISDSVAAPNNKTNTSSTTSVTSSSGRKANTQSSPPPTVSTTMCVDVVPPSQCSVPCSAGPAYRKSPDIFMKSDGLIGRCLQARESGNQLLLVAIGDDIVEVDQRELSDRDPGFSILHSGQCCCARSPFFDRVTLMDQIDTNIYNCADVLELENERVKLSVTTLRLVTQGALECVQPFPRVESASWTDCLAYGMASPDFKGLLLYYADSFENACLKHPGDKLDVCAEETTSKKSLIVPEIKEVQTGDTHSESEVTKAYFAEVAYSGSENFGTYEPTLYNTETKYGCSFEKEELAAWMLNMVFLTMFKDQGSKQLAEEFQDIHLKTFCDKETGIQYARADCTPETTYTKTSNLITGMPLQFCAEVSVVDSDSMCIGEVSPGVCQSNASSKPTCNLSLAVDVLTCDVQNDDVHIEDDNEPTASRFDTGCNDMNLTVDVSSQDVCYTPQDGQKHPKETSDGKGGSGKGGSKSSGGSSQGGQQSGGYGGGSQHGGFQSGGSGGAGGGASGGAGGGDDDPWERKKKRPHDKDESPGSKKDKKSESTDEDSDDEDRFGTVVRAGKAQANGKKHSGAYSVEKVVQHISFKPIGMENKAVEMEISPPPEIVIPVVRMSAPIDDGPCKVERSPEITTKRETRSEVHNTGTESRSDFEGREVIDMKGGDLSKEVGDFQDMVQKMWKPMEEMMTKPPSFAVQGGKEDHIVRKATQYEYKSSDGTNIKESHSWSSADDKAAAKSQKLAIGGEQKQEFTRKKVPPPVKPKPRKEQEQVYATVKQTARIPEYSSRPEMRETATRHEIKTEDNVRAQTVKMQSGAAMQQPFRDVTEYSPEPDMRETTRRHEIKIGDNVQRQTVKMQSGATMQQPFRDITEYSPEPDMRETTRRHEIKMGDNVQRQTVKMQSGGVTQRSFRDVELDPEKILHSFRQRASKEEHEHRKQMDTAMDGRGRHHTIVDVQEHKTLPQSIDTSTEGHHQYTGSNVISDTVKTSTQVRGVQSEEKRLSSSAGDYFITPSADSVISRPPRPPVKKRQSFSDLPPEEQMRLFPMLQYLSKEDKEIFIRRVSEGNQERIPPQVPPKPPRQPDTVQTRHSADQQHFEHMEHMQGRTVYTQPLNQARASNTDSAFDNILSCRPIQPVGKAAFCAQETTEDAPLTNFGNIDMVASYDAVEDESSWYSDTTGYSDEEYLSRQSRSMGSMSDTHSEPLSGHEDGALKIYHDGKLVAQIKKERLQQTANVEQKSKSQQGEPWLYSFPKGGHAMQQQSQDGAMVTIDRSTLQTLPQLEKVSPVVKHESSRAFIEDSVPGRYAEERYNTKLIHQDLGNQGEMTGMHASSFTHMKTGTWDENQSQGGLPIRIQHDHAEKAREESYSIRQRQSETLQDKYEDVVGDLKRRILGFGQLQHGLPARTQAYVEYPASTIDTSTHGSGDSTLTGPSSYTSSHSTRSSDTKRVEGHQMQFPGGVRGDDGVLRVYYDEEIISDIKNTLHASLGTRMIDDGKVLRVYHEGNLVAEIHRRQQRRSPERQPSQPYREITARPREIQRSDQSQRVIQKRVVTEQKTGSGLPLTRQTEKVYENEDRDL